MALAPLNGVACTRSGPIPTVAQFYGRATTVFVAHVTKVEEIAPSPTTMKFPVVTVEATFQVLEILKGPAPYSLKVQTNQLDPNDCAFIVLPGLDYVFFLQNNSVVRATTGSHALGATNDSERNNVLNELRKLKVEN